jgi:DNA polymerase III alpha subunit
MNVDKFGQHIFNDEDIIELCMTGKNPSEMKNIIVDDTVDLETFAHILENVPTFITYHEYASGFPQEEFDHICQSNWKMPDSFKELDIAEHVLSLCNTQEELQRCGEELLLFQERNLFDLLRYLRFLVTTMRTNHLIWGVGRGSSVSSYVLYLLGVHKINSLYYDLDPREFLR